MEIKKVEVYEVDGVLYQSIKDAEKALTLLKIKDALKMFLHYGEYKFDDVEEIIEALEDAGLSIVEDKTP